MDLHLKWMLFYSSPSVESLIFDTQLADLHFCTCGEKLRKSFWQEKVSGWETRGCRFSRFPVCFLWAISRKEPMDFFTALTNTRSHRRGSTFELLTGGYSYNIKREMLICKTVLENKVDWRSRTQSEPDQSRLPADDKEIEAMCLHFLGWLLIRSVPGAVRAKDMNTLLKTDGIKSPVKKL